MKQKKVAKNIYFSGWYEHIMNMILGEWLWFIKLGIIEDEPKVCGIRILYEGMSAVNLLRKGIAKEFLRV